LSRKQAVDQLAALVAAIRLPHPVRVAIDGIDAAGKTTLADELAVPI
jgi:uridine kinase